MNNMATAAKRPKPKRSTEKIDVLDDDGQQIILGLAAGYRITVPGCSRTSASPSGTVTAIS